MKLSLKQKILFLGLSGIFILSVFSSGVIYYLISNTIKIETAQTNTLSDSITNAIEDQFYERYGDVRAFATRFINIAQTKQENENYLNKFIELYGIYDLIIAVDLNGNLIGVNNTGPDGKKLDSEALYKINFKNETWFQGVINKNYLEDKNKGFKEVYIEGPFFNPLAEKLYGKKTYLTIFSTYIYNSAGEPIGIISTHGNFKYIEDIFIRAHGDNNDIIGFQKLELTLLDKDNKVIIDYDPYYQKNDNKILHDESILNKLNLSEKIKTIKEELKQKQKGLVEMPHTRKKIDQYLYYNELIGPKIVDALGWKILVGLEKSELLGPIYTISFIVLMSLTTIIIATCIGSVLFSNFISNKIETIGQSLFSGSKKLLQSAATTTKTSQELSSATTQQAAALQETVSALTEINSMLVRTTEMSTNSQETALTSSKSVEEGKNAVRNMVEAIQNIKKSTDDIFGQVEAGNQKISEIVQVIGDIETKTKIINEIVFQTKLLSFNAAVEAARAGESGKGFAVVAEEVGNLAHMSGNASKEISALLEQSTTKVKNIIEENSSKVARLVKNASDKIHEGENVSVICTKTFEEIYEHTNQINTNINEIQSSTKEQTKGVQEITQAMHELDSVTQQNANIATHSSHTASELLEQSRDVEGIADSLILFINGEN